MPLYLMLYSGPRADIAKPILALSDQRAIENVLQQISKLDELEEDSELSHETGKHIKPLRLVRQEAEDASE